LDRITEAFGWPFRDPEWLSKILIIGLLFIIPIVGWINGVGWMLNTMDNLRAGTQQLAPGNLSHLARGVNFFVVYLVYYLALFIVYGVLAGLGGVLMAASSDSNNAALVVVGLFFQLVAYGWQLIASLAILLALPAILLQTERGGIGGGLNVVAVVRQVRVTFTQSLLAGLMLFVASFISALGVFACCVGVLFTGAYATAMWAWIFRSYELGSGPQPSPGQLATT